MNRAFSTPIRILISVGIILFFEIYSFLALQIAIRNLPNTAKWICRGIYFLFTILFWVSVFNYRSLVGEDNTTFLSKYALAFLVGFAFAKILTALIMFIGDIVYMFQFFIENLKTKNESELPGEKISRSSFLAKSALAAGALMLGTVMYGTNNKYNYKIKKLKLRFPNFPKAFDGLRVVQISDIHSGSFDDESAVERGVQMILDQKADLILFTGDLVNEINTEIIPYKKLFSKLTAPMGVYAILGNHDYGDYYTWDSEAEKRENLVKLKQHFKDMNWNLMLNSNVIFQEGEEKLALIGVENWGERGGFQRYGRLDIATENLKEENPNFQILMSHDPSHWDAKVRKECPDIDLTLSGHTHGMQFGVYLSWMKWSPAQYMYKEWMGLYQKGKQFIYVNPGFGFLGYKGRVGIMPEITVFEFFHSESERGSF